MKKIVELTRECVLPKECYQNRLIKLKLLFYESDENCIKLDVILEGNNLTQSTINEKYDISNLDQPNAVVSKPLITVYFLNFDLFMIDYKINSFSLLIAS
jgi:hypothetical protein